jgi:hypothetical protein
MRAWIAFVLLLGAFVPAGCGSTVYSVREEQRAIFRDYVDAWRRGDAEDLRALLAPSFVLHDPDLGTVDRDRIGPYLAELGDAIRAAGGGASSGVFLDVRDTATRFANGGMIGWTRWSFPGTSREGASLIHVSSQGVLAERQFHDAPFEPR